jgi:hypothetical protein
MATEGPGKRSFFKYAAPDTVLVILRNKTVRYSSPLTFNDPFDIQVGLHFDFDVDDLHHKVLNRLYELATAPTAPQVDTNDPWGQLVLLAREHYPTHGFPRGKWETMTAELFAWLVNEFKTTQRQIQEHWRNALLPGVRVFCVSEDRDNLLMWAHYTRDHTGAVFEFLSLPDEDNPLSVARPVVYVDHPPPFFTEVEWLDDIFSIRKFDLTALSRRYVYSKSVHWSYEREWRVWYPRIPAPKTLHDEMPIRQSEFAALYIGCRAKDSFVADATSLARSAFPSVRIYRARKIEDDYALEYKEI